MINQIHMCRAISQSVTDFIQEVTDKFNDLERSDMYSMIEIIYSPREIFSNAILLCTFKDIHCYNKYMREHDKFDKVYEPYNYERRGALLNE